MSLAIQNQNVNTPQIPLATMSDDYFRHIHKYLDDQSRANLSSTSKDLYKREVSIRNSEQYSAIKNVITQIIDYLHPVCFSKVAEKLSRLNRGINVNSEWSIPILKNDTKELKKEIIHILTKVYDNTLNKIEKEIKLPDSLKNIFAIAENFKNLRQGIKWSHKPSNPYAPYAIACAWRAFSNLIHLGEMEQALQIMLEDPQVENDILLSHFAYKLIREEQIEDLPHILSIIKQMNNNMDRDSNPHIEIKLIDNTSWFGDENDFFCDVSPKVIQLENLIKFCIRNALWAEAIETAKLFPINGQICFTSHTLRALTQYFCETEGFELAIQAAQSIPNRAIRLETFDVMINLAEQSSTAEPEIIDRMKQARGPHSYYEFKDTPSCRVM